MGEQQILAPNAAELQWVRDNIVRASDLVERYAGRREALPSLDLLAATFTAWAEAPGDTREEANLVVNALGLAFGQHLVERAGLQWAVVSDELGTDIAVHGEPGAILIFPTNATAKRYESKDYSFFPWLFEKMVRHIARTKAQWQ